MVKALKKLRIIFLKKMFYRKYQIGEGLFVGRRVRIWAKKQVIIGKNFYIGKDSLIESDVLIGDNVIWGSRVALVGRYDHHYQQIGTPIRLAMQILDTDYNWKGLGVITVIENDVWVGYGATILAGVKIGEGSIIGACSLVTRDVEPYSIYAGAPAKKVKDRFDSVGELRQHLELVNSKYKGVL